MQEINTKIYLKKKKLNRENMEEKIYQKNYREANKSKKSKFNKKCMTIANF